MSSKERFYTFCTDCHDNEDNAPFQNDLTKEWKVSKASRYTAYQSPLLTEEPSGFYYLTNRRCEFYFIVSY